MLRIPFSSVSLGAASLAFMVHFGAAGGVAIKRRAAPSHAPIAAHSPAAVAPFDAMIQKAAHENGLDPLLIKAIIAVESQFNVHNISPAGACGLMQLLPATARLLAVRDIFDPEENINAGAKHLRYLTRRFPNNMALSLAAYNAGERPVLMYKGIPPYPETQEYVRRVLRTYREYQS